MARRVALLDRDGTILVERHYLADPAGVELLPNAADGLRRLRASGFDLVVVTNQSGLARGYFDTDGLAAIHARMAALLAAESVTLDAIYVCPHLPTAGCACRKPAPGLVRQAAADLAFDPAQSIAVGDKACDVDLGQAVGARTFLVRTGYGEQTLSERKATPDHIAADLTEVAHLAGKK